MVFLNLIKLESKNTEVKEIRVDHLLFIHPLILIFFKNVEKWTENFICILKSQKYAFKM
jgi:hypothetical protein